MRNGYSVLTETVITASMVSSRPVEEYRLCSCARRNKPISQGKCKHCTAKKEEKKENLVNQNTLRSTSIIYLLQEPEEGLVVPVLFFFFFQSYLHCHSTSLDWAFLKSNNYIFLIVHFFLVLRIVFGIVIIGGKFR